MDSSGCGYDNWRCVLNNDFHKLRENSWLAEFQNIRQIQPVWDRVHLRTYVHAAINLQMVYNRTLLGHLATLND